MTEPIPTPAPAISEAAKAWVSALLSTLATLVLVVTPFLPADFQAAGYAVGAVLGVIGVPFGVYVTVNKPVVPAAKV